ncbi:MAG: hypothetical protein WA843_00755, partial [Candidatus Saccharimonadales bacterium]
MGKKNNIIEINGKRYDAQTGEPIDKHVIKSATPQRAIDGIIRPSGHSAQSKPLSRAKHVVSITDGNAAKKSASTTRGPQRQPAKSSSGRTPQPARTLMRRAVKKPTPGLKRHLKPQSSTDRLLTKPKHAVRIKKSVHRLDDKRLQSARRVPKSKLISRFAEVGQASVPIIAPEPIAAQFTPVTPRITADRKPVTLKRPKTTADLLEHALQRATSHQQPPH